jgi:MFS family permease
MGGLMVGFAMFTQYIAAFTLVTLPEATGHGLGRSAAVAGLVQLPAAVVVGSAVIFAGRLAAATGARSLLRAGAGLIVVGFALSAVKHGSLGEVVLSATVVSAGLGLAFCAPPILIAEHVSQGQTAAVNALNALARVVGSVVASAVVTAVMATGSVSLGGVDRPAEWTFVAACLIGAAPAAAVGLLTARRSRLPVIHHEVIVPAAPVRGGPS